MLALVPAIVAITNFSTHILTPAPRFPYQTQHIVWLQTAGLAGTESFKWFDSCCHGWEGAV